LILLAAADGGGVLLLPPVPAPALALLSMLRCGRAASTTGELLDTLLLLWTDTGDHTRLNSSFNSWKSPMALHKHNNTKTTIMTVNYD
jgi:hypothetical protein